MAYLRGDIYLWSGDDGVHFWTRYGSEDLKQLEWSYAGEKSGGICLPNEVVDDFAIMRFAEILKKKSLSELRSDFERICADGNFGADALRAVKEPLMNCITQIHSEKKNDL